MKFFKWHNTNPLRVLAKGFLVKFDQFLYVKYELFKFYILKYSRNFIIPILLEYWRTGFV